jgi:hypothetical protein
MIEILEKTKLLKTEIELFKSPSNINQIPLNEPKVKVS